MRFVAWSERTKQLDGSPWNLLRDLQPKQLYRSCLIPLIRHYGYRSQCTENGVLIVVMVTMTVMALISWLGIKTAASAQEKDISWPLLPWLLLVDVLYRPIHPPQPSPNTDLSAPVIIITTTRCHLTTKRCYWSFKRRRSSCLFFWQHH